MWNPSVRAEFSDCIKELINDEAVQSMDNINHHVHNVSCLDHCIFVAYVSFVLCKKLKLDYVAAARAGLLHDLYLCDWSKTNVSRFRRLLIHPAMALKNAERFELSDLERDIILKHMWPVTLRQLPGYRESAVVNLADKLCACVEFMRLYDVFRAGRALSGFNHRRCVASLAR
ncbi:MAG TPA: HD domain-containing protein [Clostridia bacterium]|nr:HD domain-containing protein [Clostridia bacterium]